MLVVLLRAYMTMAHGGYRFLLSQTIWIVFAQWLTFLFIKYLYLDLISQTHYLILSSSFSCFASRFPSHLKVLTFFL
jgi:hypothetical protein